MRYLRLSLVTVAILAAAACSDSANPAGSLQPGSPRFDGGGMVGSGNRNDSTRTTTNGATAGDTTSAFAPGGGMVGSGN